ncbi:AAA family ATPase [Pseudonocardia sp.]|jgi:putative ATP-dependent endonuclease of OLD family|uniref:ATP-dependent nuclease n=1 Tax=Pseudonocardia sp. TaxID=60912 RepID=UPI00261AAEB0|nr:AAA family ATPase [Pseudonocardia sp.]MCW2718157.1 hypothetical protein [Pseudonocardia sp.]
MPAPRLAGFSLRNFRSIGPDRVHVKLPESGPLVLIGENNAGKSNIVRAVDILFNERWASTYTPEDHEFYGRDRSQVNIQLAAHLDQFSCDYCSGPITHLTWTYDEDRPGEPQQYRQKCGSCSSTYPKKTTKFRIMSMSVAAERSLNYQLSYSSRYTLLSRLMRRFHQELNSDESRKQTLRTIYESLVTQFHGVDAFSDFQTLLSATTRLLGQNLPYALAIDFSAYDPSNYFHTLRVQPQFSGEVRSFDELGTGQLQILAIAFAYAYAKAFGQGEGLLLLVDEPESNLHPLAQQWLARQLHALTTDGLQIIVTTHSPHFVDLAQQQSLVVVKRQGTSGPTTATQCSRSGFVNALVELGAPADRTTEQSVEEFYASAATVETTSGMFARACIVVEGRTEAFALPELLRLVGFEALTKGIAFVSAEGISNIAKWCRLYGVYGIPTFAIFDTDSSKSGNDATRSETAQKDIESTLRSGLTSIFPLESQNLYVSDNYATLDPDFEGCARSLLGPRWTELETQGRQIVGASRAGKPLVARYAAKRMTPADLSPEATRRLTELAEHISALVPDSDAASEDVAP